MRSNLKGHLSNVAYVSDYVKLLSHHGVIQHGGFADVIVVADLLLLQVFTKSLWHK